MRPSFAVRRFELDPTYQGMRALAWLGVIEMKPLRDVERTDERPVPAQPT
jgi:hypothetical protein